MTERTIGFGGGCHWCTEAVFQFFPGTRVEQGYAAADPPHDAWSEAVRVRFDPARVPLAVLVEAHLRTHASTSAHSMRGKYRSAIYVPDGDGAEGEEADELRALLRDLQSGFERPLVTRVLPLRRFRLSDERFRDYYRTDPERPFCRAYVDPKLALLRSRFAA